MRSLEIDYQFDLGGLHNRQIARLFALENPASVDAGLTIGVAEIGRRSLLSRRPRRTRETGRSRAQHGGLRVRASCSRRLLKNGSLPTMSASGRSLREPCGDRIDIASGAGVHDTDLEPERASGGLQASRMVSA